jgi:secreted trypsin-like serine protease
MPGSSLRRIAGLVLTLAALAALPAGAHAGQRIVGGHAPTRAYPHQVYLQVNYPSPGIGLCGGSLVAARFVVTAGHCLETNGSGEPPSSVDVAIGVATIDHDHTLFGGSSTVPAANRYHTTFLRHPEFQEGLLGEPFNDVALLTLDRPAPDAQLRLPRPGDSALWAAGVTGTGIGWGVVDPDTEQLSNTLLEVQLPVISDTACSRGYGTRFHASVMLCAGAGDGKDTCQGDSGGPLLTSDGGAGLVLAGVTSFGPKCGTFAGVYTRIGADPLNRWVRERVPQIEIDPSIAQPEPGQDVTFTARPGNPLGAGALGGYDHVEWDLDGDGQFSEAGDELALRDQLTTPPRTVREGVETVAVRATRQDAAPSRNDSETRVLNLPVRFRSPVAFAAPAITITEGQAAVLTINKTGRGAGAVVATPAAVSAVLGGVDVNASTPVSVPFAADQASRTLSFTTVDDAVVEPAETFRVDLSGHTGDLQPGSPGSLTVTILDNDVPLKPAVSVAPRSAFGARKGFFPVTISITVPGLVRATLKDRAGRTIGTAASRSLKAGRRKITVKLNARGRKALERLGKRKLRATLTVALKPDDGAAAVSVKRTIALKR